MAKYEKSTMPGPGRSGGAGQSREANGTTRRNNPNATAPSGRGGGAGLVDSVAMRKAKIPTKK